MKTLLHHNRQAFTLVELLVTISVIGVLMAMTLPAVQSVRQAARRISCQNNLRQIGLALLSYESGAGTFPAGSELATAHAWSSRILPQLEQGAAFGQLIFKVNWNDPSNLTIAETNLAVFTCPSSLKSYSGSTDYCGISGSSNNATRNLGRNGILFALSKRSGPVRIASVTDGTSNTIMVAEAAAATEKNFAFWACGFNCMGHDDGPINNLSGGFDEIASFHPGGASAVFADGSTHFLTSDLTLDVIGALCTRNNGEVISDFN